jgi:hypothetical protein
VPVGGRQPQGPEGARAGSNVTAILVDVVVRDKAGEPVPGLRAEDFVLS